MMGWSRLHRSAAAMAVLCVVVVFGVASGAEPDEKAAAESTRLFGTLTHADGSPAAGLPLAVQGRDGGTLKETTTDGEGQFELELERTARSLANTAYFRAGDDQSLAITPVGVLVDNRFEVPDESRTIILSPTREAVVSISDAQGEPIGDVKVILQLDFFPLLLRGESDREGKARFLIPESNEVRRIMAWKNGEGFAHRAYVPPHRDDGTEQAQPPKFNHGGETLQLDGARSISVRVVNHAGQPVPGQTVYPWLLRPPDQLESINLSFFPDVKTVTDEAGVATFAWIPRWQTERITFWNSGTNDYTHRRILIDPETEADQQDVHGTLKIAKLVPLSGRVVDSSGTPVSGATVSIAGNHVERHFDDVTTDEQGSYQALVPPDMAYLVTAKQVRNDRVVAVADTLTGFAVFPGKPYQAADLVLREPTVVSGRLSNEDGIPLPDQTITFYHYGVTSSELPPARYSSQPILFYYAKTDENGRFDLSLGDGNYDVRPPGQRTAEKFEIAGPSTRHFDLTLAAEIKPNDPFTGTVLFPDGRPASGALIEAFASGPRSGWKTKADLQGRYSVKEHREDKTIQVWSTDKTHAASVPVSQEVSQQNIVIQPVGSVELTLVDEHGEVMANREVQLSATLHQRSQSGFISRGVGTKKTDDQGRVRFQNLVPDRLHRLSFEDGPDKFRRRILTRFRVGPGEHYQSKVEVKLSPSSAKPYTPPTTKERLERLLSVAGKPTERFEQALRKIAAYEQKLLIVIGTAESEALEQWTEIKYGDSDYRKLAVDYATMVLASDRDPEGVGALMEQLNVAFDADGGLTLLMIDRQGSLLERIEQKKLTSEGQVSSSALVDFIKLHPITFPTARERYDAALAQAKREDKLLFVQETATWCGPCHKLTDLLLANTVWEKDYVYVRMDHRLDGAFELMKELRAGSPGGIPWFAILNHEGEKLITSNNSRDDQNIGFPSSSSGREHFARIFEETSLRMTEADISSLLADLEQPEP